MARRRSRREAAHAEGKDEPERRTAARATRASASVRPRPGKRPATNACAASAAPTSTRPRSGIVAAQPPRETVGERDGRDRLHAQAPAAQPRGQRARLVDQVLDAVERRIENGAAPGRVPRREERLFAAGHVDPGNRQVDAIEPVAVAAAGPAGG